MRQTPSILPHLQRVEAGILFLTFTGPLRKQTHAAALLYLHEQDAPEALINRLIEPDGRVFADEDR